MSRKPLKQRVVKQVAADIGMNPADFPKPVHAGGRGSFYKGQQRASNAGRKKGVPNKTTALLKDAIIRNAAVVGSDGNGTDGLDGYLQVCAVYFPKQYMQLMARVLPYQVNVQAEHEHRILRTRDEVEAELRLRGLPVPKELPMLPKPKHLLDS